jgi:hypothetical protein
MFRCLLLAALVASSACSDGDGSCPSAVGTCSSKSASATRASSSDAGAWRPQPPPARSDGFDEPDAAMSLQSCEAAGTEICNAIDDDCDGKVDEDADATCYPDGVSGCSNRSCSGSCALGKRACVGGELGACSDATTPHDEQCTGAASETAIDEDCDGKVDEHCSCTGDETIACYTSGADTLGVGPCRAGVKTCQNGQFGGCTHVVAPQRESCENDGADDDCNGTPDDVRDRDAPCTVDANQGACKHGSLQCPGEGAELRCITRQPSSELCNGVDDDCNGTVDDGFDLNTNEHCGTCDNQCESGSECCDGQCVDTHGSDLANCGACGNACSSGSMPGCCAGRCVDLLSDQSCGRCDNACGLLKLGGGFLCHCQMVDSGPNCVGTAFGNILQVCR